MKTTIAFAVAVSLMLMSGCAKIYVSPDAKSRAGTHQIIAIIPPKVSIAARKKVDAEAIKEQQRTESRNFQQEMYSWMLRRKMQNRIFVEIQDIETTNARLAKADYPNNPMSPAELSTLLEVDGVITSKFALSKPISDGAAIAIGLIGGVWGATNNTTVSLEIHDRETQKLLWNYNHEMSGSVGSTPAQLVDNLMRQASKRMPYVVN